MGVSAQQHRLVTGSFAAKYGSSGWGATSSGEVKPRKNSRKKAAKTSGRSCASSLIYLLSSMGWQCLLLLVTVMVNTMFMVAIPAAVFQILNHDHLHHDRFFVMETGNSMVTDVSCKATWQVAIQLLRAGDVESNPGPGATRVTRSNLPGDDRLNEGKALLIQKAPSNIRLVFSLWEPGKSDIKQCMDKQFHVPLLKEALGWLWQLPVTDKSISKMNKHLVIENIILRFEALLPASCGQCQQEYCVGREDPAPSLSCHGCSQGFHQECLETLLGGLKEFPSFPGVTYWLCPLCTPTYSPPVTSQGGLERPKFRRRRLSPVEDLSAAASASAGPAQAEAARAPDPPPAGPPPQQTEDATEEGRQGSEEQVEGEDCPQYLLGTCQFGISGKLNGTCPNLHRKRCPKYMKWGSKHANGCKVLPCPRAHPSMCIKSLDLKCLDRNCPVRLHTSKCARWKAPNSGAGVNGGSRVWETRTQSQGDPPGKGAGPPGSGGAPPNNLQTNWQSGSSAQAPHPWSGVSGAHSVTNQTQAPVFQNLTVQHMLEAQQKMFKDMMLQFQQQMLQQQYQVAQQLQGGGGLHSRPFSFPTSSA